MKREIILICEDSEIARALIRGFKAVLNVELTTNTEYNYSKNANCFLVFAENREVLYKHLWAEIRINNKAKTPVIAFGVHNLDTTVDLRDKVFKKLWRSHAYFQVPFDLKELLDMIDKLSPLTNLRKTIKEYSDNRGLLQIAFHELSGLIGDIEVRFDNEKKERIHNLLVQVKELLKIMKGAKIITTDIDRMMTEIKKSVLSEEEYIEIQRLSTAIEEEVFQ